MHGTDRGASKAIDLAARPPVCVGALTVDPTTRQFCGPTGTATVRPQVMLVFLTLAEAAGAVVSRNELVLKAWSGRFVAEDSLNGAISELRKVLRTVGAEGANIVTIPKTGYRLTHPDLSDTAANSPALPERSGHTRRWLIAGAAVAAVASGAALMRWRGDGGSRRVEPLIDRGLIALRQGLPEYDARSVSAFRQAIALDPDHARAWGLLALALKATAEYGAPSVVATSRNEAEAAARRALSLDPHQSDAQTALALLTPSFGRWREAEQRLRGILRDDPQNSFAVAGLATLLMSTGQVGKCLEKLEWLNARVLLSPNLQFRRVYTLWSTGDIDQADATADRALQSWPQHPAVWFARMWTFAFTGRIAQAQAMLADSATRPTMPPPALDLLGLSLNALARPGSPVAAAAIRAHVAAAARGPGPAVSAIMVLSGLGAASQAYEVARGFLLQRGDVVVLQRHSAQQLSVTDQHHRMTMMLWIPATRALREEPRFLSLCSEMGLADYWRSAAVRPDSWLDEHPRPLPQHH